MDQCVANSVRLCMYKPKEAQKETLPRRADEHVGRNRVGRSLRLRVRLRPERGRLLHHPWHVVVWSSWCSRRMRTSTLRRTGVRRTWHGVHQHRTCGVHGRMARLRLRGTRSQHDVPGTALYAASLRHVVTLHVRRYMIHRPCVLVRNELRSVW